MTLRRPVSGFESDTNLQPHAGGPHEKAPAIFRRGAGPSTIGPCPQ